MSDSGFTVDYTIIRDALRYCKGHCDSDEEYELVSWVEEKIQEHCSRELAGQIVSRVNAR